MRADTVCGHTKFTHYMPLNSLNYYSCLCAETISGHTEFTQCMYCNGFNYLINNLV